MTPVYRLIRKSFVTWAGGPPSSLVLSITNLNVGAPPFAVFEGWERRTQPATFLTSPSSSLPARHSTSPAPLRPKHTPGDCSTPQLGRIHQPTSIFELWCVRWVWISLRYHSGIQFPPFEPQRVRHPQVGLG